MKEIYEIQSLEDLKEIFNAACLAEEKYILINLFENLLTKEYLCDEDVLEEGIIFCCENNKVESLKFLITSEKTLPYLKYNKWGEALQIAIVNKSDDIFKYLSEYIETNNMFYSVDYNQLYKAACICGNIKALKYLFAKPNPIPDVHFENDISFLKACFYGNLDVVKFLLESELLKNKIDINTNNDSGIIYACMGKHKSVVKYLLMSPTIKKHSSIHINGSMPFIFLCENNMNDVLDYFIFKKNMEITESIYNYLKANDNLAKEMFKKRDAISDLDKLLENKNIIDNKETKI